MAKRTAASRARAEEPSRTVPFPDRSENFAAPVDPGLVSDAGTVAKTAARTRPTSRSAGPTEDAIRLRAYHRYLERGGQHGGDFDDWVQAERELRGRRGD
jgi:hypothetical protein